jgi:hypothetical protein
VSVAANGIFWWTGEPSADTIEWCDSIVGCEGSRATAMVGCYLRVWAYDECLISSQLRYFIPRKLNTCLLVFFQR